MTPRLRLTGLRSALAGPFDLTLAAGEAVAVTGPSGAGKSLFLRMIADLDPHEGEAWLDGVTRSTLSGPAWRRRVTYCAAEAGWWDEAVAAHFPAAARPAARALATALGLPATLFDGPVAHLSTGERQRLGRFGSHLVALAAVAGATALTALLALTTAIRPVPWYDPRYAIPLAGIVLGSVPNAASLALDSLLAGVRSERVAIEARLALGTGIAEALALAPLRRCAAAPLRRQAIRRGLLPIVNQMSAAGVVTLPGIMTGQILAGLDPIEAVKYQILLMFLISGGCGLAAFAAVALAAARLADGRARLRLDRLTTRPRAGLGR